MRGENPVGLASRRPCPARWALRSRAHTTQTLFPPTPPLELMTGPVPWEDPLRSVEPCHSFPVTFNSSLPQDTSNEPMGHTGRHLSSVLAWLW